MRYEKFDFSSNVFPIIRRNITLYDYQHKQYTHFHKATEICYIHEGALRIHLDQTHRIVQAGSIIAIPSFVIHLYEPVTPKCRYTVLIFEQEALLTPSLCQKPLVSVSKDVVSIRQLLLLLNMHFLQNQNQAQKWRNMLTELMMHLTKMDGTMTYPHDITLSSPIEAVLNYLAIHYTEELRIENIAQMVGYHPDYLCRLFKKNIGLTISEYWNVLRCDLARHRLMQGHSVSYAARCSGFTSLNYFSRIYKRIYGISPSATLPDCPILRKQNHRTNT